MTRAGLSSRPQTSENIESRISERRVNLLGGFSHEVDHIGLDLWAIGLIGLPMVESMLVGVFELFWTEARDDDRQRVCFEVRQSNRQSDVGHQRFP